MSYLDVPRLHFAGKFYTDPSTINNYPSNYDVDFLTEGIEPSKLKWNPTGSHAWKFRDCTVQSVCYADGTFCDDPRQDSVIGMPFTGDAIPYPAKLTSFDVEAQIIYEIWAFNQVGVGADGSFDKGFKGSCRVTQAVDGWQRAPMPPHLPTNNPFFTAHFLTVLDDVEWGNDLSPFLQQLQKKSPKKLAINFIADGYTDDPFGEGFIGRLVGTVGPMLHDDPAHFVRGRLLRPTQYNPKKPYLGTPMFFAPFKVVTSRNKLILDLGNSMPATRSGGPPPELGDLRLAVMKDDVKIGKELPEAYDLGQIKYQGLSSGLPIINEDIYRKTAFVQEFDLKEGAKNTPLAVVRIDARTKEISHIYLKEDDQGRYLIGEVPPPKLGTDSRYEGEGMAIRMNPGDRVKVELHAMAFGEPKPDLPIELSQSNTFFDYMAGDQGAGGAAATSNLPPVGVPKSALHIVDSDGKRIIQVTTDDAGMACFFIKADAPLIYGKPPRYQGRLEGQIYGIAYSWMNAKLAPTPPNLWNFISVKIHNELKLNHPPTWKDVQPIFAQFAGLYPYMKQYLDLSNYNVVSLPHNARLIETVLRLPVTHPNFMPVSRDLSRDARTMIIQWLQAGAPRGNDG